MAAALPRQRAGELWREALTEQALILYAQGYGYRKVAEQLSTGEVTTVTDSGVTVTPPRKVSYMWVKRAVDRALSHQVDRTREAVDRMLQHELAALRSMEHALAEKVAAGDPEAIRARLRIMDRRAKYMGLDQPVIVNATVTTVPEPLRDAITEARARNAATKQALTAAPAVAGADVVTAELVD